MKVSLPLLSATALATALTLSTGCASTLRIQVQSSEKTNKGQVLYMMVRSTTDEKLIAEDYDTASERVFSTGDESVKKVQAIVPGKSVTLTLPRPTQEKLALYFFFTEPGTNWKLPIDPPAPAEIFVDLGDHEIRGVQVRRE
jgi:hypothetical protein